MKGNGIIEASIALTDMTLSVKDATDALRSVQKTMITLDPRIELYDLPGGGIVKGRPYVRKLKRFTNSETVKPNPKSRRSKVRSKRKMTNKSKRRNR